MLQKKKCPVCGDLIVGRIDKKFCTSHCKSAHHYNLKQLKEASVFEKIDSTLKNNRRILKEFNKAGKATVRSSILIENGFDSRYYTHTWIANNGNQYFFCYEFGYMQITEKNTPKFLLIHWQKYMENSNL